MVLLEVLIFLGYMIVPILFFGVLFYIRKKRPEWKGQYSEKLAYHKMLELPDEYNIFNDLFFENNGYTTQIDHVVVSPYGVFVIETKGYKGWILGGENSEYWTQVIYKRKSQFYNPIKQNEGHVRFLRHLLLNSAEIPIIPIVVFNDEAELKVYIQNHIVVNRYYLTDAIMRYRTAVMSEETRQWVIETLNKHLVYEDKEKKKQHIVNTYIRENRTISMLNNGVCPECGGQLVQRNGRHGRFFGCSNYPKCRYTIK